MADNNVIRRDVVQIGFEVEQSPLNRLEREINEIQSSSDEMAHSAQEAADEVSRIGRESVEAAQGADRLRNNGLDEFAADANEAARATNRLSQSTEEATEEVADMHEETQSGSEESNGSINDLTSSVGDLTTAFAGVAAAFAVAKIVQGAAEVEQALNKLEAQTGATKSEMQTYGESLNSLYLSGTGESLSDIADAMGLVNQQFKDLDSDTMTRITNNAKTLSDTFDMDVNETLRGVNALMTNMGLTADEAFDYIVKGAQNGLDKSKELTDNIAEYSQLWAQAGFSAEDMFAILQNGLDSGAYNLDKVNDFVKEFTISLSDGRVEKNIDSFSERTKELFVQWKSGGASQKDVFNSLIADLGNMKNEQEALTVASTVWSALGEDNAMKVITSLNDVNSTYQNVEGTMQSINDIRYDDIGTSLDRLTRAGGVLLNETISPAISGLNNMLADGLEWVAKFNSEHEALAKGVTAAALAATALTVGVGGFVAAATLVPPALAKVSASFAALNISMGPIGIALLGISAAVGIATAIFANSEDEVEDYNGTLEECRQEIDQTAEAHKRAVKRYGENSKAAKGLEKDLKKLNAQYEKGGGYAAELEESLEEAAEAFKKLSSAQDDVMTGFDKTEVQGLQAVSMLEALAGKTEITSTDLDTMSRYADYLNDTFNCNIVVNYDTGELTGFDPQVVAQQIIDSANDNRVKAAMDYLTGADFTSGYLEAAKNVEKLTSEFYVAESEYNNRHYMKLASEQEAAEEQYNETKDALEKAEKQLASYDEELEEYGKIVDDSGDTTEMFRDALMDTAKNGGDFISFAQETAESAEDVESGMGKAQEAVSKYNDQLYGLAQAYDEALIAAQKSVEGQYEVWDSVGDIAQTSIGELQSALQSQSDYWASYSDNLAILQEKAQGIEGLSDMLSTMADGSEDSASAIAALAGASDEDLSAVVANWQSVKENQDIASQSIADTATQFSIKVDEMSTDMLGLVDDMDMSTEAQNNAKLTINSFIDTMLSTINTRKGEVTSAVQSLMSASSTSGINISVPVEGNAVGTTNSADVFMAGEAGAELVVGKQGSTVFPASETNKIISAVQDYTGGYTPSSSKASTTTVVKNETYAPQFTLNMNGASATSDTKRKVKRWVKESLNEVFSNLATDNNPIVEV